MIEQKDIIISKEMIWDIAKAESDFCKRVRKCNLYEGVKFLTIGYKNIFNQLERFYGKDILKKSKILEIGTGNGFFFCYALKTGLNIVGIEPGNTFGFKDRYERAINLLRLNGIANPEKYLFNASAENLPFNDNSFDIVFSTAVLEHVQSLDLAMKESIRVLKSGGMLWANLPNYNSFYEGHYNIFWIPHMKKNIAKIYVEKIFQRDPYFIDELNFISPNDFKKYLNSAETYGRLYLHSVSLFAVIFEAYKYCVNSALLPDPKEYSGIKKISILLLRMKFFTWLLRGSLYILVRFCEFIGLAITFDMVLYKRSKS